MKSQLTSDKFVMSFSIMCLIHCLFAPSLIILSYSSLALTFESELIHKAILLLTIPVSIFAISLGYKNHSNNLIIYIGIGGLTILISALLVEDNIGSSAQTVLTMIGSMMVIFCHYRNYKICKKVNCECHKSQGSSI
ncbi:MerC domain-containing protein [Gammaproteobacteria bacterium]|nr:MerC domain-containing protein [Gammaproteobacteria bacterium]